MASSSSDDFDLSSDQFVFGEKPGLHVPSFASSAKRLHVTEPPGGFYARVPNASTDSLPARRYGDYF